MPLAFTNAIFVDAERDAVIMVKKRMEEKKQSRYKIVMNRLKKKIWCSNPFKKISI